MKRVLLAILIAAGLWYALGREASVEARGQVDSAASIEVEALSGELHRPLEPGPGRHSVLFFLMEGCPIANAYAPEIQAIEADHAGAPFDFYLVYVGRQPPAAIAEAVTAFGHSAEVLLDPELTLAQACGATISPEACVVASDGTLTYRGRIDNWYGDIGRKRPAPSERDLRTHLERLRRAPASFDGEPVQTVAVGCALPDA